MSTRSPGEPGRSPTVVELQQTVRRLEQELERRGRGRVRRLLLLGAGLSLVVHLAILGNLGSIYRLRPSGPAPTVVSLRFAEVSDEQLTTLDEPAFEESEPLEASFDETIAPSDAVDLAPQVDAPALAATADGAVPALGGSGGATGAGELGGGGAGTSFFGVSSRGTRFAYIVDVSGSMRGRRLETALGELSRSIQSLPDYASFVVVLFEDELRIPWREQGWIRATPARVVALTRWLSEVQPGGGTRPLGAFQAVFELQDRPDVIFFLTDGEIQDMTAEDVAALNSRGRRVTVNTVAFGDDSSQALLKRIARETGGLYTFIRSEDS